MSTTGKPAQRQIAELAGVSQATVSMVVNGRAEANRIPQATRERIEAVMREVGYVPNVAARLLRGQRNNLIGVHTYERVFPVSGDDYYNDFLIGIEEEAVNQGVDLVLFTSTLRGDGKRAVYQDGMNRLRLADGAIFFGLARDDQELERLAADKYPFVFIGRRDVAGETIPYVTADHRGAIVSALTALMEAGHDRLAYIVPVDHDRPHEARMAAYVDEAHLRGVAADVIEADPEATSRIVSDLRSAGATGLIVESLSLAEALRDEFVGLDLSVPGDVSIVVVDAPAALPGSSAWSTLEMPRQEMGAAALRLLLQRLDDPSHAEFSVTLPVGPPGPATIAPPRR